MYIDVETLDFEPKIDEIHQIGAVCEDKLFQINLNVDWNKLNHDLPIKKDVQRFDQIDAFLLFIEFINKCRKQFNLKEDEKFRFAGKHTKFDWEWLDLHFKHYGFKLDDYFYHSTLDIEAIVVLAQDLGFIPKDQSLHLEELVKFFHLDGQIHESLSDCINTKRIYETILNRMKTALENEWKYLDLYAD